MIEVLQCPVCDGKLFHEIFECKDYTVSQKSFHVKQCSHCQLAITSPRPDSDQLGNYYKSEEYISHSGKSSGGIGTVYKLARSFALNWKKGIITKYKSSGNALDFGCGTGEFIHTLQKASFQVAGVEPSDTARTKAELLNNINVSKNLEEIENKKYDVITAWHVIEHVPDLNHTLEKFRSLLAKDGIIFIAVPNYQSPDSTMYQSVWAGYDVPRHLWHFSKKSMTDLLIRHRLKVIEIIPMKLDSYYVSLLSEKYLNNNSISLAVMLKAILSGLKSNFLAKSQVNHSSLIYIAKVHEG